MTKLTLFIHISKKIFDFLKKIPETGWLILFRGVVLHVKSKRSEYRCDGREDEINPHRPLVLCFWCHGFLLS